MSRTLFVGNLSTEARRQEIEELCVEFGEVLRVSIPRDRQSGTPRGFAFVEFGSPSAARNARQALQGFDLHGRPLRVDLAKDKGAGRPAPRQPAAEEFDEVAAIEEKWKSEPGRDNRRPKERGSWKDERHRRKRRGRGGVDDDDNDW